MSDPRWALLPPELSEHDLGISYYQPAVVPAGCRLVDVERLIGRGPYAFERAATGLLHWEMHRCSGLGVSPLDIPGTAETEGECEPGDRVTLRAHVGPWGVIPVSAPCLVVGRIDRPREVGLVYATLPGHPKHGEQSFVLSYRPEDNTVWAHIYSVSRPASILAHLPGWEQLAPQ